MNKASPVTMRKILEVVEALKKAGVLFVPIPVLNDFDYEELIVLMSNRLQIISDLCAKVPTENCDGDENGKGDSPHL